MKRTAFSLLCATLLATTTMHAEDVYFTPTEEGRQAMVNELVGSKATPESAAPFNDGDALPISPGMPTMVYDSKVDSYGMSSTSSIQLDPTVARTAENSYGRYRVVCHGKAVNSLGYDYVAVINYSGGFNKFTIYCYDTTDNALIYKSDDFSLTTVPDFITDKSYLSVVRKEYSGKKLYGGVDLDPFSGTASSYLRNNEMLNSFVSLSATDLDHDGTEEPIFCDGQNIYVFSFADSQKLELNQTIKVSDTSYGTASCTSLAYDIDSDGSDDYVAIVIPDPNKDADNAKMFFTFLTHSADGITVTRREVRSNQQGFLFYKNSYRAMVNASKYCPTGSFGETWLAVASTSIFDYTDKLHYGMPKLAIIRPDWDKIQNGDDLWYDLEWYKSLSGGDYFKYYEKVSNLIYDDYNVIAMGFGKPILCQGYLEGIGAPASLLWKDGIYTWNSDNNALEKQKDLSLFGSSNTSIIGSELRATSLGSKANFSIEGKEVFVAPSTNYSFVEYDSSTDHCYSYSYDKSLNLLCIGHDDQSYTSQEVTLNSSLGSNAQGVSMLTQPVIEGLKLKLLNKSVTISTPAVECILAVPPYVDGKSNGKGNVSFSNSQSSSQSMTESQTQSVGVSVGLNFSFTSWLKAGISAKHSESWTSSMGKTLTLSQSTTDAVNKGEDMVAFTYVPVDVFDYEIVSDNPDYNGQTFSLMRARTVGIKHDVMTVHNYNLLVGPAGGMVIDSSILPHTPGDVSSYIHCPETDMTAEGARNVLYDQFAILKDEIIGMSNIFDVPSEGVTKNISLSYGEGGTVTEGSSTSNDVSLSFNLAGSLPFSISTSVSDTYSTSWSMSTGWNKNVSIQGSVPYIVDKADNFYSYRLVWYRMHRSAANGTDRQDFMVGNWIICEDQTGNVSGVSDIEADGKKFDPRVFSIDGRYMGTETDGLTSGVYIRNGHKIVVTKQ